METSDGLCLTAVEEKIQVVPLFFNERRVGTFTGERRGAEKKEEKRYDIN